MVAEVAAEEATAVADLLTAAVAEAAVATELPEAEATEAATAPGLKDIDPTRSWARLTVPAMTDLAAWAAHVSFIDWNGVYRRANEWSDCELSEPVLDSCNGGLWTCIISDQQKPYS